MANTNLGLLKPYRQYSEMDVLNHASLHNETGRKGSLVSWFDNSGICMDRAAYSVFSNLASTFTTTSNNAYSPQYRVLNRVKLATSGERPIGMMLYDALSTNLFGTNYRYDAVRAKERECVSSGDPMPIVQRGYFLINVGTGTTVNATGSYLAVSDSVAGAYRVVDGGPPNVVPGSITGAANTGLLGANTPIGKFQGTKDSDGYALVYIDCNAGVI